MRLGPLTTPVFQHTGRHFGRIDFQTTRYPWPVSGRASAGSRPAGWCLGPNGCRHCVVVEGILGILAEGLGEDVVNGLSCSHPQPQRIAQASAGNSDAVPVAWDAGQGYCFPVVLVGFAIVGPQLLFFERRYLTQRMTTSGCATFNALYRLSCRCRCCSRRRRRCRCRCQSSSYFAVSFAFPSVCLYG